MSRSHEIRDVACTVCGCVCDDLRITVQDDRIISAIGSCPLSEEWFLGQNKKRPAEAEVNGNRVSVSAAVNRAQRILSAARSPLVFGLARSSTEGQRAAIRLADQLGACIDTSASLCHAPSIMAIQQVGESTCTLGEVRNRADLVVFWGVDPVHSHPRHAERYSVFPKGEFIPNGRRDRTIVVIDSKETATSELADISVQLDQEKQFELIWRLRSLVNGVEPMPGDSTATPRDHAAQLAQLMTSCRCGVVFFGLGLARASSGHRVVEALLRLVAELNAHTRFHARRMRIHGDVAGADTVLSWQTGYPFAVNLNRGYPRYNPGEYSAEALLRRREVDACLLVGSEAVRELSPAAQAHLAAIPTILLDSPMAARSLETSVRFTTAIYGVHRRGTAYRMDEVPIPLKPLLTTCYPSDAEVLNAVRKAF